MADPDNFRHRLEQVVEISGGPGRLSTAAGISRRVLDQYRSGRSDPSRAKLVAIATAANVSVGWLADGSGDHETGRSPNSEAHRHPAIDQDLFRAVALIVQKVHEAEGVKLPPGALTDEQTGAYNTLLARAEDPADTAELQSLLPWLETRLRKTLKSAAAAPGTGKREA